MRCGIGEAFGVDDRGGENKRYREGMRTLGPIRKTSALFHACPLFANPLLLAFKPRAAKLLH
jgi:hypothetical protein